MKCQVQRCSHPGTKPGIDSAAVAVARYSCTPRRHCSGQGCRSRGRGSLTWTVEKRQKSVTQRAITVNAQEWQNPAIRTHKRRETLWRCAAVEKAVGARTDSEVEPAISARLRARQNAVQPSARAAQRHRLPQNPPWTNVPTPLHATPGRVLAWNKSKMKRGGRFRHVRQQKHVSRAKSETCAF